MIDPKREVSAGHRRGWSFTPLNGKVPRLKSWQERGREQSHEAMKWTEEGNVGLRTGQTSGIVVVDLDLGKGAVRPEGLPETVTVETGGGGQHLYYAAPKGVRIRNSAGKIAPHVDLRGDGGQVVFVGSIHPDTKRQYRWADGLSPDDVPIAPLPQWIADQFAEQEDPPAPPAQPALPMPPMPPAGGAGFAGAALKREIDAVASAPEGTRNDTLNTAAFNLAQLVAGGELEEDLAKESLVMAAMAAGLPEAEARQTMRSGFAAGSQQPRQRRPRPARDAFGGQAPRTPPAPGPSATGAEGDSSSEVWFSRRIVLEHGSDVRYTAKWACWHVWNEAEGRWLRDDDGSDVACLALRTADGILEDAFSALRSVPPGDKNASAIAQAAMRAAMKIRTARSLRAAMELARAQPAVRATPADWDSTPGILNARNHTLNILDGSWTAHDRSHMLTRRCNAAYDPDAVATRWEAFLEEVVPDDEVRAWLQKAVGYAAIGRPTEDLFVVLTGKGGNGKSTFLRAIHHVLADLTGTFPDTMLMASRFGSPELHTVAELQGVRVAFVHETPEGGRLASARLKAITGGDPISACRKYERPFSFNPTHTIFLDTNNLPRISDPSRALQRRIRIVRFPVIIPQDRIDPQLDERLAAEADGILGWIVAGALLYLRDGLAPPPQVLDETTEYLVSASDYSEFIATCLEPREGAVTTTKHVHDVYEAWCDAEGVEKERRAGRRTLTRALRDHGIRYSARDRTFRDVETRGS